MEINDKVLQSQSVSCDGYDTDDTVIHYSDDSKSDDEHESCAKWLIEGEITYIVNITTFPIGLLNSRHLSKNKPMKI